MRKFKLLILNLCLFFALTVLLINCKKIEDIPVDTTKVTPVVPAAVTPSAPAPVTVVAGKVTEPAATAAVATEIASGTPSASTTATTQAIDKVLTVDPTTLAATLSTTTPGATLSADVQTQLDNVAKVPEVTSFLSTIELPTVDGTAISGGRLSASVPLITKINATVDECKAQYQKAFDDGKVLLDAGKTANDKALNDLYASRVATINAGLASCKTSASKAAAIAKAVTDMQKVFASIDASSLPARFKALVKVLIFSSYNRLIINYTLLEKAETAVCGTKSTKETAAAAAARDKDLAAYLASYNTALNKLTTDFNTAYASCHNQGN